MAKHDLQRLNQNIKWKYQLESKVLQSDKALKEDYEENKPNKDGRKDLSDEKLQQTTENRRAQL